MRRLLAVVPVLLALVICGQAIPPAGGGSASDPLPLTKGFSSTDGGVISPRLTVISDGGSSGGIRLTDGTSNTDLYIDTSGYLHSTGYATFDGPLYSGSMIRSTAASGQVAFKAYTAGSLICLSEVCAEKLASDGFGTLNLYGGSVVQSASPFAVWYGVTYNQVLTTPVRVTGTISNDTTAVGNVGAGEDTLISKTIEPTGIIKTTNGYGIEVVAHGTGANNANAKTLKCYFGSTVVLTHNLPVNETIRWRVTFHVSRTGASAQDYSAQLIHNGSTTPVDVELGSATESEAANIVIKCTGEATADNDIVQEGMLVKAI